MAFCLGGRPAIYNKYMLYISFIYSMYTYTYTHIWRATHDVKNPPANNYAEEWCVARTRWPKRARSGLLIQLADPHHNTIGYSDNVIALFACIHHAPHYMSKACFGWIVDRGAILNMILPVECRHRSHDLWGDCALVQSELHGCLD